MNPSKRFEIFSRLKEANPNPTTELVYKTPFELLIAVVLSAQATDKSVNAATKILFQKANTPESIFSLGEIELKNILRVSAYIKPKQRIF